MSIDLAQISPQLPVTYYDILEVSQGAGAEEIKKSYRRLALRWHPDCNRGSRIAAENKLKALNEAYAALRDPARRARYDHLLTLQRQRLKAHNDNGSDAYGLIGQFWTWLFAYDQGKKS